ncbi:MAG: hypothetical protein ACLTOX_00310 [Streptococcus thermophilus]
MNAYASLMKVVLDVKQEKEELKVATMVFSKTMTETRLLIRQRLA